MSRSTRSFDVVILSVALGIMALAVPAAAQQPAGKTNNKEIFADYYAATKSIQQQHYQKLAEIDERYRTALRAYSEENVKRAQSMAKLNNADHSALKEKGLKGEQQQAEYRKVQARDKKRRAEYAEWRDSTSRQLREEHAAARSAEIERHKTEMQSLLADRNAKLAGIRALDGSIGLTPGATAALGEAAPAESGPAPDAEPVATSGDGSESDAEVDVDGLEMLGRADDSEAGIRTADDASSDGSDEDPADPGFGLEMLGRDDEAGGSPMPDAAPPPPLPPIGSAGNRDLLGGQGQSLPVPEGVEPPPAATTIAVAYPSTGDVVEVVDSGLSEQAFELSATTSVNKSIQRMNFRVLKADGTIVLEKDICGGTAGSTECDHNPRFSDVVDLSDAGSGSFRLAVQALDSEGDAVSRIVEFQVPYHAIVAADVDIVDEANDLETGDCTWTVSGRVIDWDGNPVARKELLVEARRDSKRRAREHREWTDWKAKKWGTVTTDARGQFTLRSKKLDHCGGKREFRVSAQVGQWNLNLGQALLPGKAAVMPDPLVLPRAETNTSFDILTYNVALIMGFSAENRQKKYRAKRIGRRLHRYHVVVLNEAFRNQRRWALINEVKGTWGEAGYATTVVGDGRPAFDNGGVDIVTRLPVLEEHATEYSKARDTDRLADKGAVHARVRATNGQLIDIFGTHLQAGGDRANIRVHQLSELRDFIVRHSDRDVPFLVLGDMNLKTAAERSNAIRILREARPGVRDAWQWRGVGECVTTKDSGRCLDFIYVGNLSVARPLALDRVAVRKFEDAASRTGYLSDHFGVEAGFTIQ
ncbi:MAG: endonuclease/exonuclease/phosphatase family protein [Woeseiaceae bacterium]|nr:endonuclease/exonuclease/phosphatase family protein [Woeseiaceae bacterium]